MTADVLPLTRCVCCLRGRDAPGLSLLIHMRNSVYLCDLCLIDCIQTVRGVRHKYPAVNNAVIREVRQCCS
jgi:hypothetical protein